jgi:hypothetical protein
MGALDALDSLPMLPGMGVLGDPQVATAIEDARLLKRQPGFSFSTVSTGLVDYDGPGRRIHQQYDSIVVTFGGFPVFSLKGNMTNTLFYNTNTNYTWGEANGYTMPCTCEPIDPSSAWPTLAVPTGVTPDETNVPITSFGQSVTADLYRLKLELPGAAGSSLFKVNMELYQEVGTPNIVVANMTYTSSAGGSTIDMQVSLEFKDIVALKPDSTGFVIPSDCPACATGPPVVPFPTSCTTDPPMCQCPVAADLPFCGDIVVWPIMDAIAFAGLDDFVKLAYNMDVAAITASGIDMSEACKEEFKAFLCGFYFPYCDKGFPAFPALPTFDKCPAGFQEEAKKIDEAMEQYK